jgi:hypothetical protein
VWAIVVGLGRVVGLTIFGLTLAAGLFGNDSAAANLAPFSVYVAFWVGMQFASAIFGDVWSALNPLDTIARGIERVRARPLLDRERVPTWLAASHWPAVAALAGFHWLELAYHDPASPRLLATLMLVYTAVVLAGVIALGRSWIHTGDGFAVYFRMLGALSPLARLNGKVGVRLPVSGLTRLDIRSGTVMVVLVVLGGTSFDGLSRTRFWITEIAGTSTGWTLTLISTLGLLWMIAVVTAIYVGAMGLAARVTATDRNLVEDFATSLVPIALGYAVAHYFSLFVLDGGQNFLIRLSDPFGRGWDLIGTGDWQVDFLLVSTTTIAWVQAAGIVVGHVVAVLVAHDRALEIFPRRDVVRSQFALLAVMVAYTVGGLVLLLGA